MSKRSKIFGCHQQPTILTRKRKVGETSSELLPSHSTKNVDLGFTKENESEEEEDSGENMIYSERWPFNVKRSLPHRLWFPYVKNESVFKCNNSPMPLIRWADAREVWNIMIEKDDYCQLQKDHRYLDRHPGLQPRMRAIVLDWLIEVCEVYRLQRDTYLLAMDFFDRYFTRTIDIEKQYLQLVGITCLFLASKYEEIYPPKLQEFAYVTDGACTKEDILDQEIVLLKVLEWDSSTLTVTDWLHVFLQLQSKANNDDENNFLIPNYSAHFFFQITQLIDLCTMDVNCLRFAHRTIAASALFHMSSLEILKSATGFEWDDVSQCIAWMMPFMKTLVNNGLGEMKFFAEINNDDCHNVQVHLFDVGLFDKVIEEQNRMFDSTTCASPVVREIAGVLTPPNSHEKPIIGDYPYT